VDVIQQVCTNIVPSFEFRAAVKKSPCQQEPSKPLRRKCEAASFICGALDKTASLETIFKVVPQQILGILDLVALPVNPGKFGS